MTGKRTLFGEALTDLYDGQPKGCFVVSDETGDHPLGLAFYLTATPDTHEREALQHARGRILDVGCGAGRILKHLQDEGADASGFDIDPMLIALCKRRGISKVSVESYDNLSRFAPMDTILFLNRTICTAGSLSRVESLLSQCHQCCSCNSVLIFDSVEVRPEMSNVQPGVMRNALRFKYAGHAGEPFDRIYFTSNVAEDMIRKTGWFCQKIIRDRDVYAMVCSRQPEAANQRLQAPRRLRRAAQPHR